MGRWVGGLVGDADRVVTWGEGSISEKLRFWRARSSSISVPDLCMIHLLVEIVSFCGF